MFELWGRGGDHEADHNKSLFACRKDEGEEEGGEGMGDTIEEVFDYLLLCVQQPGTIVSVNIDLFGIVVQGVNVLVRVDHGVRSITGDPLMPTDSGGRHACRVGGWGVRCRSLTLLVELLVLGGAAGEPTYGVVSSESCWRIRGRGLRVVEVVRH